MPHVKFVENRAGELVAKTVQKRKASAPKKPMKIKTRRSTYDGVTANWAVIPRKAKGKASKRKGMTTKAIVLPAARRKQYPGCFEQGVGKGKYWFCAKPAKGETCHKSKSKWWPLKDRCVYKS